VLLGDGEREEPVLGEDLEVPPRVEKLVVGALRVGAHLALAEVDQLRPQLLLALGQEPVGIPVVAESPEGLSAPHLVRHSLSPVGAIVVQVCTENLYRFGLRVSTDWVYAECALRLRPRRALVPAPTLGRRKVTRPRLSSHLRCTEPTPRRSPGRRGDPLRRSTRLAACARTASLTRPERPRPGSRPIGAACAPWR
jgi:hypothetical protein